MPLHDWTDQPGWEGVHIFWMTEIARWLKAHLPPGYRAFIGTSPLLAIDVAAVKPDVAVQSGPTSEPPPSTNGDPPTAVGTVESLQPDLEIAVGTLQVHTSVLVEQAGRLVAAVELVSPRNKDRPAARAHYGTRYLSYLKNGVHLQLVDVHPRPLGFSFATLIAEALGIAPPPFAPPLAVSYRVGEPAAEGGRLFAVWQRALTAGQPLPRLPLALAGQQIVIVDLDATYQRAARDAYLE
jgi:hypothetical protein